jgi:hypothetical protein
MDTKMINAYATLGENPREEEERETTWVTYEYMKW